jgi:type IV pilus assembly protein PilX
MLLNTKINTRSSQQGAALLTALIMLIAVTLLSLASLGTSMMELRMSGNEESSMQAFQSAQAAVDALIDQDEKTPLTAFKNFAVTGSLGYTQCSGNVPVGTPGYPASCQDNRIILPTTMIDGKAIFDDGGVSGGTTASGRGNVITIERISDSGCPPRSSRLGTSCSKQSAAVFRADSVSSQAHIGQGRGGVSQGYLKLIPKGDGQNGGSPPTGAANN